jgi:hypothetical protein
MKDEEENKIDINKNEEKYNRKQIENRTLNKIITKKPKKIEKRNFSAIKKEKKEEIIKKVKNNYNLNKVKNKIKIENKINNDIIQDIKDNIEKNKEGEKNKDKGKNIKYISPKKEQNNNSSNKRKRTIYQKKSNSNSKRRKKNLSKNENSDKSSSKTLNNNNNDITINNHSKQLTIQKKRNINDENEINKNYESYESEEINDNTTRSRLNNTQKLNISENTISAEELTLRDDDLDKMLKYINKEKDKKFKTIPEVENENNIDTHNNNNNNIIINNNINDNKDITKTELLNKLKRSDQEIKEYLENIIYSKLLNKKEILKRKKRFSLVYKGKNNEIFKISGNLNFMQNFNKHSNTESEEEELMEEENEKQSSDNSEESKSFEPIKIEDDIKIVKEKEKIKKDLIYDNSYLFKKSDKKIEIRKEVEDIIKGTYNKDNEKENNRDKDKEFDKEKFEQKFLESYFSRKKFKKRKKKKIKKNKKNTEKQTIFLDEDLDEQMYLRRKEIYEKEEFKEKNKELQEKSLDWRINYFFNKIKQWRDLNKEDFIKQFDKYAEFDMNDFKIKRDKEDRIRDFILGLNDYRVARKVQRKLFDTYLYKEPILIENCSPDKNKYNNSCDAKLEKTKKFFTLPECKDKKSKK